VADVRLVRDDEPARPQRENSMTMRQAVLAAGGVAALVAALMIPAGWFVPLPPTTPVPTPPVSGHALVRIALVLDGLLLFWLVLRSRGPESRVQSPESTVQGPGTTVHASDRLYGWLLVLVTLTALVLRLIEVNADLWLDEITPVRAYRDASAWEVFITYRSSNNHLLNTLLVKAAIAVFGEHEWAIRLPAVLWGTVTIPVLYWVARQALSRHASLCAAALLAVSYHHVFFSQNARGYSAYVCLSLLSSGLLVRGLAKDSPRVWAGFVAATVLNFSAHLISGFVFAAHAVVAFLAGHIAQRPSLRRLISVFGLTAFLGFQLYAAVLPQVYVLMGVVYTEGSSGFRPFSMDLVREVARGLGVGFGPGLLLGAIPLLAIATAGFVIFARRHWVLAMALTLPVVLQATVLVARGLTLSPRFFVLALPLAILVAVQAIVSVSDLVARSLKRGPAFGWWLSTVAVLLLGAASATALPRYYRVPKQAYRASLAHVESARQPNGLVVEIHYAEAGFDYYRRREGMQGSPDYLQARTVPALDAILAAYPDRPVWLLTTFPRALRIDVPDLDARIKRDFEVDRRFPGTIGDGDIYVWRRR
jgi:mannosyltransferase